MVKSGAPEGTRTPNLLVRSEMLYPIEPQALERAVSLKVRRALMQNL